MTMATTSIEHRATRPDASEYNPYYGKYIQQVPDGDVVKTLVSQAPEFLSLVRSLAEDRGGHRYAPGKWSIREVIGHVADGERIFAYRALRFARGDQTALPGFDENAFVANAHFDDRSLESLASELEAARTATVAFFDTLTADEWARGGTASNYPVTVRALAWIIAGHERHHLAILRDRYL
jgi:uncharacterized damage-inducible protein DinB